MRPAGPGDIVVTPLGARFLGRRLPCTVGRGGVAQDKREGDGATPEGCHRLIAVFWRADRLPRPGPGARPIRAGDLWCDDPADPAYNSPVHDPGQISAETLRRADPLYDVVIASDWNWPARIPGRGSAIFLHAWRRPGFPTAGCVAFARPDIRWIAENLRPETRLIVRPR